MSIISTSSNYGGRVIDNQQGVKQFFVSPTNAAAWIYKKISGTMYQTPADSKTPVYIDNDLTVTGSFYNPSDERIKDKISDLSKEHTDKLFTINPILFVYKNNSKNRRQHYGVLAQDVEKVFPELIDNNISGFKSVNYQELIPIMLAKMKQMQDEIDALKSI